jgi:hypothetical protein
VEVSDVQDVAHPNAGDRHAFQSYQPTKVIDLKRVKYIMHRMNK